MCAAQPNGSLYDLDPWDQPISHVDLEVHGSSESAAMALAFLQCMRQDPARHNTYRIRASEE